MKKTCLGGCLALASLVATAQPPAPKPDSDAVKALIEKARKVAQSLFERDPQLADPQLDLLNQTLSQFWNSGKGDAS